MSEIDKLVEVCLDKATREHCNKSEAELNQIVQHNYLAIHSTNDEIEAAKMLGEMKGCQEILRWRKEEEERILNEEMAIGAASADWLLGLQDRKKKAAHNLPAATSYHGQLVAAILDEEDNLTAEGIRQWADELVAMDDEEYKKLLDALVDENILYINNDGNYSLLTLCTPNLFPTDQLKFLKILHPNLFVDTELSGILAERRRAPEKFLRRLAKKSYVTEKDWMEITKPHDKRSPYKFDNDRYERAFRSGKRELKELVDKGILRMTPIPDTELNLYYFAMLGEKEGE